MKMKKLFLTIVVAALILLAATTNVNAATVSTSKIEVEKAVAVTVDFGDAENADGSVTYDPEVLTFVSGPSVTYEPTPGTINFSMSQVGGLKKATFNFIAKAAGTTEVTVNVTNSKTESAIGTFKGSVEVTEKAKPVDPTPEDPKPVDPTPEDPKPVDPTPVDPTPTNPDNGNQQQPAPSNPAPATPANPVPVVNGMPTRLPQTGINYAVIAMIALAIIAVIAGTIKLNNK